MLEWIDGVEGFVLRDNEVFIAQAFVIPYRDHFKARKIKDIITYRDNLDWAKLMAVNRQTVFGPNRENPRNLEEGKQFIERDLGIVVGPNKEKMMGDVMSILAKIKDFEVHGRIELIIKVEYVNPPAQGGEKK